MSCLSTACFNNLQKSSSSFFDFSLLASSVSSSIRTAQEVGDEELSASAPVDR